MSAQDLQRDEASTIRRLLAERAAVARTQQAAVRDALAAAMDALEQGRSASAIEDQNGEIAALVDRLAAEAAADIDRATKALDSANAEASRLTADLHHMREQLDAAQIARDTLADQLASSTGRVQALETTIAEGSHVAAALNEAQRQLQTNDRERQTLADDLARRAEQIHVLESEMHDTRAIIEHLPLVFRAVAASRTMTDALTAVANGLSGLFPRVVLFRAKADRLEGVHQSGFDFAGDISIVVIPLTFNSVMSDAVSSDCVTVLTAEDLAASHALPFAGTATSAIVLPLSVDGKTAAAVYADDGGRASKTTIEQLGTCAGLVRDYAMAHVQRLVGAERSLAELNAYAEMLLNEVERLYAADVAGGHDEVTLRARVLENLQTARRIYAHRVEQEAPAAASFLEERIVSVARGARTTPFGRDVLEVAFNDGAAANIAPMRAAQAS